MGRFCNSIQSVADCVLRACRRRRAVFLIGAGASIEYGAPSTYNLTTAIGNAVMTSSLMRQFGADTAFSNIQSELAAYLNDPPNFEQIYHCAHELLSLEDPVAGAVDEFKPLLIPFITKRFQLSAGALGVLIDQMASTIFSSVSAACRNNPVSLDPLRDFIGRMRKDYVARIYTTNYDDFILQAVPDLYFGFPATPSHEPKRFELDRFWHSRNLDAVHYLHGSVHMGFPAPPRGDIGELFWFDNRDEAQQNAEFHGSRVRQMDGTQFARTAVITGLDKLSRLQQRPLSHFYSALSPDMMEAEIIFVVGSGLADLHLNTWLKEARSRFPKPPLVFVDFWKGGFLNSIFGTGRKEIEMFHALGIHIQQPNNAIDLENGWTVSRDGSSAIWDRGFQAFLNAPQQLNAVLGMLKMR